MTTTVEYPAVDRTGWAKGPWDDEPDRIAWKTLSGLHAMVSRNKLGALSGHVAIPADHPYWQMPAHQIRMHPHRITYAGEKPLDQPPPRKHRWWIGFHYCHGGNYAPVIGRALKTYEARPPAGDEKYYDIGMAIHECEKIARELVAVADR